MIQKWSTVKRPSENERYYPPSRISKNNALSTFKQSIIRIQGFCTLTVQNSFRVASLHLAQSEGGHGFQPPDFDGKRTSITGDNTATPENRQSLQH